MKIAKTIVCASLCAVFSEGLFAAAASLYDLRVNSLKVAENIGSEPTFSWKTTGGAATRRQTAVRVTVSVKGGAQVWDSGEVATDKTTGLEYGSCGGAATALKSATRYTWTAKTKDAAGTWTAAASGEFFTGILADDDWAGAAWIANSGSQGKAVSDYRATFTIDATKTVKEAFWGISSLGINEAYVNGESVVAHNADGSTVRDRLRPGFTEIKILNISSGWTPRRHSYTYDVTDQLKSGANVLAARVGIVWWKDEVVRYSYERSGKASFRGVLIVRYTDGTETTFVTDKTNWKSALVDPVTFATLYGGEEYDARKSLDWLTGDLPATGWAAPTTVTWTGLTTPSPCPSVRFRDDLALAPTNIYVYSSSVGQVTNAEGTVTAHGNVVVDRRYTDGQAITINAGDTLIVDFGQNCGANPKFVFSAAEGTVLTAYPAEILNAKDGLRSQYYDGPGGSAYRRNYREATSHISYTFAGSGDETYLSEFTYYGYQILSITATATVTIKSIRSIPISSVNKDLETGSFACSNKKLERLERNCYWGHLSNHVSVPTTCPSRDERSAWLGDAQAFAPAACWNANSLPFFTKEMNDVRDGQAANGGFNSTRPLGDMTPGTGSGWTDGYPLITWLVYRRYGDIKILKDNWRSVTNYLSKVSPTPGKPTYDYYFGDWLANGAQYADKDYVSYAFNMKILKVAEKMAHALGYDDAEAKYAEEYAASRDVFRSKFISDGKLAGGSGNNAECRYAMALNFGAFEESEKASAAASFVSYVKNQSYRVRTGYMGTIYLLDALAVNAGSPETAYSTLLNEIDCGGWMHEINMGATAIWEDWRGINASGKLAVADTFGTSYPMNCFNNNPNGTVEDFLYSGMGGIRDDESAPGYKRFKLRPFLDTRIGSCAVTYESPYGQIKSSWTCAANGDYTWNFTIPANSTADVTPPGSSESSEYNPGTYTLTGNIASACDHSWGEWVVTKAATETTTGTKERTCSKCGKVETAVIPATGASVHYKWSGGSAGKWNASANWSN